MVSKNIFSFFYLLITSSVVFAAVGFSQLAEAQSYATRGQITIVCKCFAETKANPTWDYFGYAYGSGESIEAAYQAAVLSCLQKPAVIRDGGAAQVKMDCD